MDHDINHWVKETQILFELSMSIGNSLNLKTMLKPCVFTFLKKLNCIAGGIYQFQSTSYHPSRFQKVYTIPRRPERNETYIAALNHLGKIAQDQDLNCVLNQLPIVGENENGRYYHIFPLQNFGVFILVKNRTPLRTPLINSLLPLFEKLAYSAIACINESKLRQSEETHRILLKSINHPIFALRHDGTILFCNDSYATTTGHAATELEGIHLEQLFPNAKQSINYQIFQDVLKTGKAVEYEYWEQNNFWRIRVSPTPWGILSIATNATERKSMELAREELITELETKNAELERFTYTVSHDLKSPLITIRGFLGYINQSIEQEDYTGIKDDIQHIVNATNNMNFMLNDLLELSRIGRLINTPEQVAFSTIVKLALQTVAGQIQEHNVSIHIQDNLPDVFVDKSRLVEVLQNLISNAIKFTHTQAIPKIEIGVMNNDVTPIFFVKDNGIGIDSAYHKKIFGLFERLDPAIDGTGIGLALVKRIIDLHNGEIWVESVGENKGTTFYFTLPWPNK